MRKPVILLLSTIILFNSTAFAECDYSKDIKKNEDGSYTYTKECHIVVGKAVNTVDAQEQQIEKLNKVIDLKDLAIDKQRERTDLWMQSHHKMEDRLNTIERYSEQQKWLAFGLGVLVMGLAVKGAGQLR